MSKENGGPAFPQFMLNVGGASGIVSSDEFGLEGMTLRDYFAAKAMQSMITAGYDTPMRGYQGWRQEFAKQAYEYADNMIAERAK